MDIQYKTAIQVQGLNQRQLSRVLKFGCEATKFGNEMLVKETMIYMTLNYESVVKEFAGYIAERYFIKLE